MALKRIITKNPTTGEITGVRFVKVPEPKKETSKVVLKGTSFERAVQLGISKGAKGVIVSGGKVIGGPKSETLQTGFVVNPKTKTEITELNPISPTEIILTKKLQIGNGKANVISTKTITLSEARRDFPNETKNLFKQQITGSIQSGLSAGIGPSGENLITITKRSNFKTNVRRDILNFGNIGIGRTITLQQLRAKTKTTIGGTVKSRSIVGIGPSGETLEIVSIKSPFSKHIKDFVKVTSNGNIKYVDVKSKNFTTNFKKRAKLYSTFLKNNKVTNLVEFKQKQRKFGKKIDTKSTAREIGVKFANQLFIKRPLEIVGTIGAFIRTAPELKPFLTNVAYVTTLKTTLFIKSERAKYNKDPKAYIKRHHRMCVKLAKYTGVKTWQIGEIITLTSAQFLSLPTKKQAQLIKAGVVISGVFVTKKIIKNPEKTANLIVDTITLNKMLRLVGAVYRRVKLFLKGSLENQVLKLSSKARGKGIKLPKGFFAVATTKEGKLKQIRILKKLISKAKNKKEINKVLIKMQKEGILTPRIVNKLKKLNVKEIKVFPLEGVTAVSKGTPIKQIKGRKAIFGKPQIIKLNDIDVRNFPKKFILTGDATISIKSLPAGVQGVFSPALRSIERKVGFKNIVMLVSRNKFKQIGSFNIKQTIERLGTINSNFFKKLEFSGKFLTYKEFKQISDGGTQFVTFKGWKQISNKLTRVYNKITPKLKKRLDWFIPQGQTKISIGEKGKLKTLIILKFRSIATGKIIFIPFDKFNKLISKNTLSKIKNVVKAKAIKSQMEFRKEIIKSKKIVKQRIKEYIKKLKQTKKLWRSSEKLTLEQSALKIRKDLIKMERSKFLDTNRLLILSKKNEKATRLLLKRQNKILRRKVKKELINKSKFKIGVSAIKSVQKEVLKKKETSIFLNRITNEVAGLSYKLQKGIPTTGAPIIQINRFKKYYKRTLELISNLKRNPTSNQDIFRSIQKRLNNIDKFIRKHYTGVGKSKINALSRKFKSQSLTKGKINRNEQLGLNKLLEKPLFVTHVDSNKISITPKNKKFIGSFKKFINKTEDDVRGAVQQATSQKQALLLKTKQKQAQKTIQTAKVKVKQKLKTVQATKTANLSKTAQQQQQKQEHKLNKLFKFLVQQEHKLKQTQALKQALTQAQKQAFKLKFSHAVALSLASLQKQAQTQELTQATIQKQKQKLITITKQINAQITAQIIETPQKQLNDILTTIKEIIGEISEIKRPITKKIEKVKKPIKIPIFRRNKNKFKSKIVKKKVKKVKGKKSKKKFTKTLIGSITKKGVKKGQRKFITGTERRA